MFNKLRFMVVSSAVLTIVGCGSSSSSSTETTSTVRLQATVADRALDNARAVAIGSDGSKYWAYLDPAGNFSLNLPAGKSYRVLLVNAVRNAPGRVSGHLVIHTSAGDSRWIGLDGSSSVVDLGNVSQVATSASSVTTQSDKTGSSSDSSGDKSGSTSGGDTSGSRDGSSHDTTDGHKIDCDTHEDGDHEDEHAKACTDHDGKDDKDDCSDDDDVDLHPSKDPGDKCKDDHEKEHEDEHGKDKDDDNDHVCSAPAGGSAPAPSSSSTPPPPSTGGSAPAPSSTGTTPPPPPPPPPAPAPAPPPSGTSPAGGACQVTADCTTGLICVASICVAPVR